MIITRKLFSDCFPHARPSDVDKYYPYVQDGLDRFDINTPRRIAAFFAQIAHESGSLHYSREIASGEDYDTGKRAQNLGNTPEKDGDGQKYKGRGLIQITGLSNYKGVSTGLKVDFVSNPEKLELPQYAFESACWFWEQRFLNRDADIDSFLKISIKINGKNKETGLPNGWEDRQARWAETRKALGVVIT